jgi:hypothetical protein
VGLYVSYKCHTEPGGFLKMVDFVLNRLKAVMVHWLDYFFLQTGSTSWFCWTGPVLITLLGMEINGEIYEYGYGDG